MFCVPETEVEKLKKAVDTLMVSNEDKVSVVMRTLIVGPSVLPSTVVLLVYPTWLLSSEKECLMQPAV